MKKIVIFGSTGTIGAYFTDYCIDKLRGSSYEVVAVGRRKTEYYTDKNVRYINVDIRKTDDFAKLPDKDIYAVVNLTGILPAYLSKYDPFTYVDVNIYGALRILEYARINGADRILYTHTWSDQAGYWGKKSVLKPELPRKFDFSGDHAFYTITKSMIVDTMDYYRNEFGLNNFVFRLPNVYCYHPRNYYYVDGRKTPIGYRCMIEKASRGEDIELWGDPNAYKDILYIKDLCQMMYLSLFVNQNGGLYNAGTGNKTTLLQQIKGMIKTFSPKDKQSRIIFAPKKKNFTSFVMDISNLKKDLGYEPKYTYMDYLEDYKVEQVNNRFAGLWR